MPTLGEQLDPGQPLKQLADTILWLEFEQAFASITARKAGQPSQCA